jgi:hypothetical protein
VHRPLLHVISIHLCRQSLVLLGEPVRADLGIDVAEPIDVFESHLVENFDMPNDLVKGADCLMLLLLNYRRFIVPLAL